jgi:hypothetical protein
MKHESVERMGLRKVFINPRGLRSSAGTRRQSTIGWRRRGLLPKLPLLWRRQLGPQLANPGYGQEEKRLPRYPSAQQGWADGSAPRFKVDMVKRHGRNGHRAMDSCCLKPLNVNNLFLQPFGATGESSL